LTFILLLNRFTINSDYHNHDNTGRQAPRDDNNAIGNYWLRSAGFGYYHTIDTHFRTVALIWTPGTLLASGTHAANVGFRPL